MHLLTLEGHEVVEVHLNHLEKLMDRLSMKLKLEDLNLQTYGAHPTSQEDLVYKQSSSSSSRKS